MPKMTIDLPESTHAFVESQVNAGKYANVNALIEDAVEGLRQRALVQNGEAANGPGPAINIGEARRAEIDKLLKESEDEYERGEFTVHQHGDFHRMYKEMKRQREP